MNPKAATALANWLQLEDPQAFAALLAAARRAKLSGLGDDGSSSSPDLTNISVDTSNVPLPDVSTDTTGGSGFFSTIGSGLSTAASSIWSGISTAASDVGNFLSSAAGASTISNVAADYLKAQQTQAQAQVLQTQVARAQAGLAPASISYATSATGQVVPVYTGSTLTPTLATALQNGQIAPAIAASGAAGYALTPALTASLAPSSLSAYLPYIAIGGGILLIALLSRGRAS